MITFESKRNRVFVGRVERGEHVRDALVRFAAAHGVQAAWVSAIGAFEWVELCEYDQDAQVYKDAKRFDTPVEVLALSGNISTMDDAPMAHLHATVSRETDNGVQVLGGHVEDAVVFALEVRIEVYDDVALVREHDDDTGLSLWRAGASSAREAPKKAAPRRKRTSAAPTISRAPVGRASEPQVETLPQAEPVAPALADAGGVTWAMAAAASEQATNAPEEAPSAPKRKTRRAKKKPAPAHMPAPIKRRKKETPEPEYVPEVGEYVDHRQFGLCKVMRLSDDGGMLLRLESGRQKLIKLDFMEVLEPRIEGEDVIYPIVPKRRR